MKRVSKRQAAFTLIELLVVIAIIGILAAALFPAVSGAILRAQATAFTNRGRNIVMAVISANLEREKDMLGVLWPNNIGPPAYTTVGESTDPVAWFRKMQDRDTPRLDGVDASMLAGAGVNASPNFQAGTFTEQNLAWGLMFNLMESDSENALFMITKNLRLILEADSDNPGYNRIQFDDGSFGALITEAAPRSPFGDKMVVFVRKGGSASAMRPDLIREALGENRFDVVMPAGAVNSNTELLWPGP